MFKTKINKPNCCAICGHYLTTSEKYAGQRCLDPSHWQAVGVLVSTDFYSMARLAAQANVELNRRSMPRP
jgi:rRNA maturation endonuclease Nob1